MNKKRNDNIIQFINNIRNLKSHSYSLDSRMKKNNYALSKSIKDSKAYFKNYYKSKKKIEDNNNIKDSFNSFDDINNHYIKSQNTIQEFFLNKNNQFGLKIEGNKNLENYPINELNKYLHRTCSHREFNLRKNFLNYYYPKDNKNKLMGKEMALTPIPYKKNAFIKTKIEKEDYLNAKRAAVFMRRLEYTYGLNKNKNKKRIISKEDYLIIMKGAVKIIEDWWIKVLNKKKIKEKEIFETISLTDKESSSSLITNIIKKSERRNKKSINLNSNHNFIDHWIYNQVKFMLGNKIKNSDENFNKNNLIFLSPKKSLNYLNVENKMKKHNSNITIFKSNKNKIKKNNYNERYNHFERNKSDSSKKEPLKNVPNPIKIIQNNNDMISLEGTSKEETTITPSNYLQRYFKKDFLTKNKSTDNSSSNVNLQTLELIQNKYKTINTYNGNEVLYSINTLDNSITQEENFKQNMNSIENKKNKIKNPKIINNKRINNTDKIKIIEQRKNTSHDNTNLSNKSKNVTSDIEPIKKDEKVNIDINNIFKSFNNLTNKKKKIDIRFNITKSQSLNKNKVVDKSSMDGSVDEIITKKLKEFYKKDKKYSQRIKKAYNQVIAFKRFSFSQKINFNPKKFKNDNY